jgi:hypothetical protein
MSLAPLEVVEKREKGQDMRVLEERAALRADAATLLDELGDTASEVAVSLGSLGIQVRPSGVDESLAARYLHAVVGADNRVKRVKVTNRSLVLQTHRRWWPTIWLPLPNPVRNFTDSMDKARTIEATEVPLQGHQGDTDDSAKPRWPGK